MRACAAMRVKSRVKECGYLAPWADGDDYPPNARWEQRDGQWHYWATRRTCYTLAEVFQYFAGAASELYLWYCARRSSTSRMQPSAR